MTTEKNYKIQNNKKLFGDLPLPVLEHLDETGLIYYTIHPKTGEKIYGSSSSLPLPIYSEQYTGLSKTQQQFKDDADINLVLKKYGAFNDYVPEDVAIPLEYFRDLSMLPADFTESLNLISESNQMFMDLPAHLRRAVNDDPRNLLELSQTPEGLKKLAELGFSTSKAAPNSPAKALEAQAEASQPKKSKTLQAPPKDSDEE